MRMFRINDPALVNYIASLERRIAQLEEYIGSVPMGDEISIETEITDGDLAGRLSDMYDLGENAIEDHKERILVRKTVTSKDMDDTGRIGVYHNFVVQDSNGDWKSVSGWVM